MKSIEKTVKDFLFIVCVIFSLCFYLQGFIKELSLWNPQEGIKPQETTLREELLSSGMLKGSEQVKSEEKVVRKETVAPRNKEADRISALIQEGKLSSYKASFYKKLPLLKNNSKEQERTK